MICEKVPEEEKKFSGGLLVKEKSVPLYRVISFSKDDGFEFSEGDVVSVLGNGDEFEIAPGKSLFRFNVENVMCKILP